MRIMELPRGQYAEVAPTLPEGEAVAAATLIGEVPELIATAPSWAEIEALVNHRGAACVSLILPTTPVSTEIDKSRLLFKNLAREGLARLSPLGATSRTVSHIEAELTGIAADSAFWANQRHGLAVYVSDGMVVATSLNFAPVPSVTVADRFLITPLVAEVSGDGRALVLALSQHEARLLEVSAGGGVARVEVDGMPDDVAEAAGQRSDVDRSMSALDGREGQKVRMGRYAHAVDAAINHHTGGSTPTPPLILAAAQPLDGLFRAESRYSNLHPTSISGSPETMSDADLAHRASAILQAIRTDRLSSLSDEYQESVSRGLGIEDTEEVARAATAGAVRTLLVNANVRMSGTIDELDGAITWGPECSIDCYDVVDEIVRRTLTAGGEVVIGGADDVPDQAPVSAILRYQI